MLLPPFSGSCRPSIAQQSQPHASRLRAVGTPPQRDLVLTLHCSALWLTTHALPQEPDLDRGVWGGLLSSLDLFHQMDPFPSHSWQPVLVLCSCVTNMPQMLTDLHVGQGSAGWCNSALHGICQH